MNNINPVKELATLVNALEKISLMPRDEIVLNNTMVEEIRKSMAVDNINSIINAIANDYNAQKDYQAPDALSENALIHAYAQREHKRIQNVKDSDAKHYHTEIVKAKDFDALGKNKLPERATRTAEQKFSSVFNSVYSNGAVKINTPSDPSTLLSYIDYSPYRVNYSEYLSVPTLSEMVDRPIAMAMKKPFKVKTENEAFKLALEKMFKKVKLQSVLKDMLFNSTLSPRGSLLVPVLRDDGISFNVFNDTQFAYGMGSSYSGITAPYNSVRIGDIYCFGAKLKHDVSAFFLCPGYEPLFGVGLNRVPQLRSAAEAWNLYVHILKILLVRAQVIIKRMNGDVQTDTMFGAMQVQLQRLNQTLGVSTPLVDPNGSTTDILNNNISEGTSSIAGVFRDYVASVTGLSPEYFFGGGNTNYSQAAFQIASTNEHVRSRYQIAMLEPMARFVINTLIRNDKAIQAFGVDEDDFDIEFESIYDETEQEKAELASKRTETLIRQRDYPELEGAFKQLKLLDEDISFAGLKPDHNSDDNGADNNTGGEGNKLIRPLGNTKNAVECDPEQLKMGIAAEMEHTDDPKIAEKIALDHLAEIPDYYTRLEKMEKEAKAQKGKTK
jgi:hypothetical protein